MSVSNQEHSIAEALHDFRDNILINQSVTQLTFDHINHQSKNAILVSYFILCFMFTLELLDSIQLYLYPCSVLQVVAMGLNMSMSWAWMLFFYKIQHVIK